MNFKIDNNVDAVFTWVQPNDENYSKLRKEYLPHYIHDDSSRRLPPKTCNLQETELFYSVSLVLKNLPWIRNVFIVVHDNQTIPIFNNVKVKPIYHSQIFPKPFLDLPTFNSHSIESVLHYIPGLSEHFIYFNDDTYVLKPMKKTDWFVFKNENTDKSTIDKSIIDKSIIDKPKVFLKGTTFRKFMHSPPPTKYALHYICMINNHALLDKLFGFRRVRGRPWHQPIALSKKIITLAEQPFFLAQKNKFRTVTEYVPLPLALLIGLEKKLVSIGNEKSIPNEWITATDFNSYNSSFFLNVTLLCINDLGDHIPNALKTRIFSFLSSVLNHSEI